MSQSDPIRIGVIGCGQIAQQHFINYSQIPEATVVAVADINPEAADTSAAKYSIPNVYYTAQEMLKRDDLDAIDVCLHNNLHVSATLAALESGHHVYCEKPMAGTYHDAKTMRDRAKELGKKLHIQMAFLYTNDTRTAKELIDNGALGEIYHARSTGFRRRGRPYVDGYGNMPFVQKPISGGGALYDMGVYHISQLLYLLGNPEVKRVTGVTYQKRDMHQGRRDASGYCVEELGLGFIRFAGDLTMDLIEAWAVHMDGFEGSSIFGSKGGIRLDPFKFMSAYGNLDLTADVNLSDARYRWNTIYGENGLTTSSQEHWVAALQGLTELLPTAEIALNTMLISESIYQSCEKGEEVTAEEVKANSVSKALKL